MIGLKAAHPADHLAPEPAAEPAAEPIDLAQELSKGVTLVIAPHMDDAVLGCGGTLAQLTSQANVHIVYATDGARSPVPDSLKAAQPSAELCAIRTEEAKTALKVIGIPASNIHFLNFPDGALSRDRAEFCGAITQLIQRIKPQRVLIPFRHDCHLDHLAVSKFTTEVINEQTITIEIFEYFIYYRLQLLPKKDIRTYIDPSYLIGSDIRAQATQKRTALEAFKTQTTRFYPWQTRPLLSAELLNEVCTTPELFLQASALNERSPFISGGQLIPLITRLEPALKKAKSRGILFFETVAKLPARLPKVT
jgi:LmbE family N-acetylglucosaminyl deacetylase